MADPRQDLTTDDIVTLMRSVDFSMRMSQAGVSRSKLGDVRQKLRMIGAFDAEAINARIVASQEQLGDGAAVPQEKE